ncbi:MAG: AgmX/PglI C-terminal domain-containing protein [Myxococcales bacterium]|nr:AgmX/PglI C-terminal domain-containing protein [Myxococcales bacterium]
MTTSSRSTTSRPRLGANPGSVGRLVVLLVGFAAACGGGSAIGPAGSVEPTAPPGATPPPSGGVDPSKGGGPTTSTTPASSTLPDGGELQGAKLQSATKTTTIETKGESGPKGGSQEPGRRREDIQAVIVARRDDARKCYDDALKAHPGIEGDLVVKWTIDPKGQPTDVAVDDGKSQIHEPSVGQCVVDIIKKIKFAESAKGFETRTNYPFNFRPRGPQPAKK